MNFYRTWCLKEAHYKSLTLNEQKTLSIKQIDTIQLQKSFGSRNIIEIKLDQYQLTLFSSKTMPQLACFSESLSIHSENFHPQTDAVDFIWPNKTSACNTLT
jgi:hypothetical protein